MLRWWPTCGIYCCSLRMQQLFYPWLEFAMLEGTFSMILFHISWSLPAQKNSWKHLANKWQTFLPCEKRRAFTKSFEKVGRLKLHMLTSSRLILKICLYLLHNLRWCDDNLFDWTNLDWKYGPIFCSPSGEILVQFLFLWQLQQLPNNGSPRIVIIKIQT